MFLVPQLTTAAFCLALASATLGWTTFFFSAPAAAGAAAGFEATFFFLSCNRSSKPSMTHRGGGCRVSYCFSVR